MKFTQQGQNLFSYTQHVPFDSQTLGMKQNYKTNKGCDGYEKDSIYKHTHFYYYTHGIYININK